MDITAKTDITGMKFGLLTVIAPHRPGSKLLTFLWSCKCDCGNLKITSAHHLKNYAVKSCGCIHGKNRLSHGLTQCPEYKTWQSMKQRCYNENATGYENYGGRGVTMWHAWLKDFTAFYKDVGPKPSPDHTIERINNDLGYVPGNCRWATYPEQARNKRSNAVYMYKGELKTLTDIASDLGILRSTLDYRIRRGKSFEEAIAM